MTKPTILFVCVHNAGRSQMAAALVEHVASGAFHVVSAGSAPAVSLHANVVEAMLELGIDLHTRRPRLLSDEDVQTADVVITMGCGDACAVYPGKRYEDWEIDDPAQASLSEVRRIRGIIRLRVEALVRELVAG